MPTTYSFGKISDAVLIALGEELTQAWSDATATLQFGDHGSVKFGHGQSSFPETLRELFSTSTYLIQNAHIRINSIDASLTYYRGQTHEIHNGAWTWRTSSPFVDGMSLTGPASNATENLATLLPILSSHIAMAPPLAALDGGKSVFEQSAAISNAMAETVKSLVEHTADRQKALDATRSSLETEAQEELRRHKALLDKVAEERSSQLQEKEDVLKQREKDLEDRQNTHVRRDVQKTLAIQIDSRLKDNLLSRSSLSFFLTISLTFISAVLLAYLISIELGSIDVMTNSLTVAIDQSGSRTEMLNTPKLALAGVLQDQIMYSQVRIALQSVGLAALIWFALRVANARYGTISRWERDLHRFRLDTDRAAFLVEGDLEARKINQQGLPDVLLQSFSRGLFSGDGHENTDTSSETIGSALTALLGQAAKIQVGPTGVNVEVDGRGIRRAKKDMAEG